MPRLIVVLLAGALCLSCSKESPPIAPAQVEPGALHPQGTTASGGDQCPLSAFNIELSFIEGVDYKYQLAVQRAADRWENVIIGDKADVNFRINQFSQWNTHISARIRVNKLVDDLIIFVNEKSLPGDVVASTSVVLVGTQTGLPVLATIAIDDRDLRDEQLDYLDQIMLHEVGHALGFGTTTVWDNLLREWPASSSRDQPHFTGTFAGIMFDIASSYAYKGKTVPIDADGGHWLQSVVGDEIMAKGWTYPFRMPISEMTAGAFLDLGYDVSFWGAQAYETSSAAAKAGEIREHHHDARETRQIRRVDVDGRIVD